MSDVKKFMFSTISFLFLALLAGCKGDLTVSSGKSLNNMARNSGEVSRNVCKGSNKAVLGIYQEWDHIDFSRVSTDKVPALKSALQNALSAVPANLQDLFFGLGGKIVFTSNLDKPIRSSTDLTCDQSGQRRNFISEGTDRIEACWTTDSKTSDVVILMNPSVDSVNHATIRIFGYILSQILSKLEVSDDGVMITKKNEHFEDLMSDIAAAVVADVRRPGSKYTFSANEALLRSDEFKYFAFAEAFDSFYCNTELRRSMARPDEFPATYALFENMDSELRNVQVTEVYRGVAEDSSDKLNQPRMERAFSLGIFGGLFRGLMGAGRFLGGGMLRGVGFLGRGVGMLGKGVLGGGRAILGGGARLLGGAAKGLGNVLGVGNGGLINMVGSLIGGGGGGLGALLGGGGQNNLHGGFARETDQNGDAEPED